MESNMQVWLRRSKSSGRFHIVAAMEGINFSFCYMHRHGEHIVRVWNYDTQEKLVDIGIDVGGSFNLEFVLKGLVDKEKAKV